MHFTAKISTKPFSGLRLKTFSVIFLSSVFFHQPLFCQVNEDFADGEFSSAPSWSGIAANFIVNSSLKLQLNSTAAGTSWLSTEFAVGQTDDVRWEFYVKQSFAPSGANFGRFYLASDQRDLSAPLNGYYLQFGEAGSNDAVELFRQSGSTHFSICRAPDAGIAAAFALRVQVTRSADGIWSLYLDYTGERNFVFQATGADAVHHTTGFAGILCTYTITNATRFYYDDIAIVATQAMDTSPPKLNSIEVISANSLMLLFSEDLDPVTAEDRMNYQVLPEPGHPATSILKEDKRSVELIFSTQFANGSVSTLHLKDILDGSGNRIMEAEIEFLFFAASPVLYRDVIISEIFPDPSPQVGLPEAEFVELFNRSANPVDISQWTLSDESNISILPSFILLPGQYLILCGLANAEKFSLFGEVRAVTAFPSLNNSTDALRLRDADGKGIDSLRYYVAWYHDSEKADGGWSLERIDPNNICAEETNWVASESPEGGTPGHQNSVHASKPDSRGPRILSAGLSDASTLSVQFDEKLGNAIEDTAKFHIRPPVAISSVRFADPAQSAIVLSFSDPLTPGTRFTLEISDVYDCPGNIIDGRFATTSFVLPETAEPGDVVVNEILFNPRPTGVDFIEIYNCSEKTIDLKNWVLRNFASSGKKSTIISQLTLLIDPGEYKVFTEDESVLKGEYVMGVENTFRRTDLPALNDDMGFVSLFDGGNQVIDSMGFDDQMHAPFIQDTEGISLERISATGPGIGIQNWRSASSSSGFATPGYVNSNARRESSVPDEAITVEPEIIQPRQATNPFTQIKYQFDAGGFIANVKIFDPEGRLVRHLAENQLLGSQGFFRWDGDKDDGSPAGLGLYLVWFEIFNPEGQVKTFRKRVVVY
jgi:hypothetical protein